MQLQTGICADQLYFLDAQMSSLIKPLSMLLWERQGSLAAGRRSTQSSETLSTRPAAWLPHSLALEYSCLSPQCAWSGSLHECAMLHNTQRCPGSLLLMSPKDTYCSRKTHTTPLCYNKVFVFFAFSADEARFATYCEFSLPDLQLLSELPPEDELRHRLQLRSSGAPKCQKDLKVKSMKVI